MFFSGSYVVLVNVGDLTCFLFRKVSNISNICIYSKVNFQFLNLFIYCPPIYIHSVFSDLVFFLFINIICWHIHHLSLKVLSETTEARIKGNDIFKALKEENHQPRILYKPKLSFKNKCKVKPFPDI